MAAQPQDRQDRIRTMDLSSLPHQGNITIMDRFSLQDPQEEAVLIWAEAGVDQAVYPYCWLWW